jgi:hypothetical protein
MYNTSLGVQYIILLEFKHINDFLYMSIFLMTIILMRVKEILSL